jgi:hypothetical protein
MKSLFFLIALFVPVFAFADAAQAPAWLPPQWLQDVLTWAQGLPTVGPFLVKGLMILSVVATVMTVVASAFFAIMKSLSKVLDSTKLSALSDKVDAVYEKIAPYLQYLSIYNAKLPDKTSQDSAQKPTDSTAKQ